MKTKYNNYRSLQTYDDKNVEKFGAFSLSASVRRPFNPAYYNPNYVQPNIPGI